MTRSPSVVLTLFGAASLALLSRPAHAVSGDEFMEFTGYVPPNVIFVLDKSVDMVFPCVTAATSGSTSSAVDYWSCMDVAKNAIKSTAMHYDWVRYGVVGTTEDTADDAYYPIVPLGSSQAEMAAALDLVAPYATATTRNLSEVITYLANDYLTLADTPDDEDDDGDGMTGDWAEAPIQYHCQETHIIVLTASDPHGDDNPDTSYTSTPSSDVQCTAAAITSGTDSQCLYDNAVLGLYNTDLRPDLSGTQNVTVHTVAFDVSTGSIAETLFQNASDEIGGEGVYTAIDDADEVLSGILTVMQDIRSGTYSRSSPVVSADGDYMIYAFYELDGDNPLAEGHVRAYEIDDDPSSTTYGQVKYDGPSEYGGAVWDAGDLLVSRPVTSGESNPDDRDGFGKRDIYTFWDDAYTLMSTEADGDRRMGFDYEFVYAVGSDSTALDMILDTKSVINPPCADDQSFDYNDDCLVDDDDLQAVVDFTRGLPESTFRFFGTERGTWKLGDSPHSVPVVVQKRNNAFTVDPTYRTFLKEMEASDNPDIVLIAANDGMLHAFQLEDDTSTMDTEEGEELWAWVPGYLLYRKQDTEWSGTLIDMVLYGRTFLFDGTPVVEDVWIDEDEDGTKDCSSLSDCEWRRIVVVQQGKGGPVTLALDITSTAAPEFLWEQRDTVDPSAMGYTVSRPVIANIYDTSASDPEDYHDRWVAMWGSGRAVPFSFDVNYYESTEANLYMWHAGDDYWGTSTVGYSGEGDNGHPEDSYGSTLDSDGDGDYEYGYISAALSVVDVDSDGDADTVYFPVTAAYQPTDESGGGPGDVADPGSTWMYKACINTDSPDDLTWVEFYDPIDDGGLSFRPEVYYAATLSWMADQSLAIYWGTGSPYNSDTSENGYLFAMRDTDPGDCGGDYRQTIDDCGVDGLIELEAGEALTSDPIVYAGVLYFTTFVPDADRCEGGTGRVYALAYDDCSSGMDTNDDGVVDGDDDEYVEVEGYPSAVTVTTQGTVLVGTSNPTVDGSDDAITVINSATSPFMGTNTLAWMEKF